MNQHLMKRIILTFFLWMNFLKTLNYLDTEEFGNILTFYQVDDSLVSFTSFILEEIQVNICSKFRHIALGFSMNNPTEEEIK